MIRRANIADLDAVAAIYEAIHDEIEAGRATIGWLRGVYPTRKTAADSIAKDEMYVLEEGGRIVAAARINQVQGPEYRDATWGVNAPPEQVLVLHTLVVLPDCGSHGYGTAFVAYYEELAREKHCPCLRMDTNALNLRARRLYARLGYREACIIPTEFNGIPGVNLVCLEKTMEEN